MLIKPWRPTHSGSDVLERRSDKGAAVAKVWRIEATPWQPAQWLASVLDSRVDFGAPFFADQRAACAWADAELQKRNP